VVLTNQALLLPLDVMAATVATTQAQSCLVDVAARTDSMPSFLHAPTRHGFSVVPALRVKGDREDQAYQALSQLAAAAFGYVRARGPPYTLAWPVVVVEGDLYEVTAPDTGDTLKATTSARVFWHGAMAGHPVVVDVVAIDSLETYAARAYHGLRPIQDRLDATVRARKRGDALED
jgi:hypothetical protein